MNSCIITQAFYSVFEKHNEEHIYMLVIVKT